MDSYSEVRRVRNDMSQQAGHDIRKLIASINDRWPEDAARTIDPGSESEQCAALRSADHAAAVGTTAAATR